MERPAPRGSFFFCAFAEHRELRFILMRTFCDGCDNLPRLLPAFKLVRQNLPSRREVVGN